MGVRQAFRERFIRLKKFYQAGYQDSQGRDGYRASFRASYKRSYIRALARRLGTCTVCLHATEIILFGGQNEDQNDSNRIQLGTVSDITSRSVKCLSCQEILLLTFGVKGPNPGISDVCSVSLRMASSVEYNIELVFQDVGSFMPENAGFYGVTTGPIIRRSDPEAPAITKLDASQIDVSKIQRWLQFCDKSHVNKCHVLDRGQSLPNMNHLLLVDVQDSCLCLLPTTTRYMTLSYAWGVLPESIQTQLDNLEILKTKQVLDPDKTELCLPQTIRDAMKLVRQLGERYLWVDRLSII
ncbi:hypothetical protein F5Y12DRAFT_385064 [Xylaria sp. FL1777]|nr:hypothetical protein F5Y12DRAFT_385064 [Xylaria sp. FL1777]